MKASESQNSPGGLAGFLREFAEAARALPDKGLFFGLFVVWAALFHFLGNSALGYIHTSSLFGWLNAVYTLSPDEGHGQVMPLVVLALFWWKRKELLAVPKAVWWPALGLVVLGLSLHVIGFAVQQTRLSVVGFLAGLYGLTGLVWGWSWLRASFFPFFLLVFCVPLSPLFEPLTFELRLIVARAVAVVGQIMGIDVIRDGTQLFNAQSTFHYDVAPACSGVRSLISLLALTTVYGFVMCRRAWKRGLMIFTALPLAIIGNVVRVSLVVVTAELFDHDAGAWVEQKLGFITFAVAIVCVLLLGRWLREPEQEAEAVERS